MWIRSFAASACGCVVVGIRAVSRSLTDVRAGAENAVDWLPGVLGRMPLGRRGYSTSTHRVGEDLELRFAGQFETPVAGAGTYSARESFRGVPVLEVVGVEVGRFVGVE